MFFLEILSLGLPIRYFQVSPSESWCIILADWKFLQWIIKTVNIIPATKHWEWLQESPPSHKIESLWEKQSHFRLVRQVPLLRSPRGFSIMTVGHIKILVKWRMCLRSTSRPLTCESYSPFPSLWATSLWWWILVLPSECFGHLPEMGKMNDEVCEAGTRAVQP